MFVLKKILGALILPLAASTVVMAAGVVLMFTRRHRLGRGLAAAGLILLVVPSLAPVANGLLGPLERRYPAFDAVAAPGGVAYVAVLGAAASWDEDLPPGSRLSATALARLAEGIRIQRLFPGSRLIFSGWGGNQPRSTAEIMAAVAEGLGVETGAMVVLVEPRDTAEEARAVAEVVGEDPFVLVTSAAHMPRAMVLFGRLGLAPTPAPAAHVVRIPPVPRPWYRIPLPNAANLQKSGAAVHEYLGMAWARLSRQP